jgi:hypothetical protein
MDEIYASHQNFYHSSEIVQLRGRQDSHVGGIDINCDALAIKPAA